ncbi:hypothetical protein [Clostridium sp.]|uniref:hypothetical protein n=1 Tax=Clostridium sp. TaxID=1506 RepID=UPI0026DA9BAA|nr:hypothetical protein [Clostridium sp.]MDO5040091.1 hypothetical protein [Clostridium sp.]
MFILIFIINISIVSCSNEINNKSKQTKIIEDKSKVRENVDFKKDVIQSAVLYSNYDYYKKYNEKINEIYNEIKSTYKPSNKIIG